MPKLAYETPTEATPSGPVANPNVAANTVLLTGSGFAANAAVTIIASVVISGAETSETYTAAADASGNLNYIVSPASPYLQEGIAFLGCSGSWEDNASRWLVTGTDPTNGNIGTLTITAAA